MAPAWLALPEWLLISPASIRTFPVGVVTLAIAAYLFMLTRRADAVERKTSRARATGALSAWFACLAALSFSDAVANAIYAPAASFMFNRGGQSVAVILSVFPLARFAYLFVADIHGRESLWAPRLIGAVAVALSTYFLVDSAATADDVIFNFKFQHYDGHRSNPLGGYALTTFVLAGYAWSLAVLLRKALRLRERRGALLTMALVVISALVATTLNRLEVIGLVPIGMYATFMLPAALLAFVLYVKHAEEPATFRAKLIGLSIVTLYVPLGLLGHVVVAALEDQFDAERRADVEVVAQQLAARGTLDDVPLAVRYVLTGADQSSLTTRYATGGFDADARRRSLQHRTAGEALVGPGERFYRGHLDVTQHAVAYPLELDADNRRVVGEVGFSYKTYRKALHEGALDLLVLMTLSAALLVLLLPIFFRGTVLEPLRALLDGVRQVNEGKLDVRVPVAFHDEIGFVARSFNGMVEQIADREVRLREAHARDLKAQVEAERLALEKEKAEATNRAKTVFLSHVSHELRTPLNAILGYAHLLRDDGKLDAGARERARIVHGSAEHLLALIEDLLDLSKAETGAVDVNVTDFDLSETLQSVIDAVRERARTRGLALELVAGDDVLGVVRGDQRRLRQVLLNLAANAIKFTRAGRVTLRAERAPEAGRVRFAVDDTGPGIAAADRDRIFQPFVRLDERVDGTGLGLAISRKIVDAFGGTLTLDSELGRGSTFSFTIALPRVSASASAGARARARHVNGYAGPRKRVLVVDDIEQNRRVLRELLEARGFVVEEAADAVATRARLARLAQPGGEGVDVVLLDKQLPGEDGLSLARFMRAQWTSLPVLAVSASASPAEQREFLDAGAARFIAKPVRPDALMSALCDVLALTPLHADVHDGAPANGAALPQTAPAAQQQQQQQQQQASTPAPLPAAPPALRDELLALIRMGDVVALGKRIDRIEDAALQPLVEEMRRLLAGYRLRAVRMLLEEASLEDGDAR